MKFTLIRGCELSPDLSDTWEMLQRGNPDLASPYFHPEFTRIVATVRDNVEIAVIEDGGGIVAFFPFHRGPGSIGTPVGEIMSDYNGLICLPDFDLNPVVLIKACGLIAWDFDHLIAAQDFFGPFHRHLAVSPVIDLAAGFETYLLACHAARHQMMKLRRLERSLGPVRFVKEATDPALLERVIAWKSAQYRRSANQDLFQIAWIRSVITSLFKTRSATFGGILSALYAGEVVVAGHFGLRAGNVWHYWFPSYASEYAKHSPGLLLLTKMAESAVGMGLPIIDLGKGRTPYKERFKNNDIVIAEGSVESSSPLRLRRQLNYRARTLLRNSPIRGPARSLLMTWRRLCATRPL